MKRFQIIALTPPGLPNPSIAIAACRAGSLGVLDLEFTSNQKIARDCFNKLARFTRNEFGIKLNSRNIGLLDKISPELPKHCKVVILTQTDIATFGNVLQRIQRKGLRILLECTSLEQAATAEKTGIDGVIAKGNEAGGRIGNETTFILVQQFMKHLSLPVWAQGGIGLHTAVACYAAGAAGVVLDAQLVLTRESVLSEDIKTKIERMDGSQTICIGEELGITYRVCSQLGRSVVKELLRKEAELVTNSKSKARISKTWYQTISQCVGWDSPERNLFLFGQDVAIAAPLSQRFVTVAGILEAIRLAVDAHCKAAQSYQILSDGSPLAKSHGTRHPLVQGPMARVSDNATFVSAVARHNALPFVAAAWMRPNELDMLLRETKKLVAGMPWGVGLLGFLPPEIYKEQIRTVLNHRPPFALIAGGQPNQAKMLEKEDIATYLHVPSPGLLRVFLDSGVRRFVFEGRESGGHIGPLCSFVLWEMMIEVLLESLKSIKAPEEYHVLFAGGIHDAMSASMVAVMAATLVEKGVRVGFQLGSAYLFTEEAVATGAIVKKYAAEAIRCNTTTVLANGPGHAVRCINNAFAKAFNLEKSRLIREGSSSEEIHSALQRMQLGRMRIASKGFAKNSEKDQNQSALELVPISDGKQSSEGMYLIGQLAALKDRMFKIADLHHDIVDEGSKRIDNLHKLRGADETVVEKVTPPSNIAIIGMACLLPKAPTVQQYWENILRKVNTVTEIPENRWDWRLYYDPNKDAKDKINSKWGAFLDDIHFDPTRYGLPPSTLSAIEPLQLMTLEVVRWVLEDAGYSKRSLPNEHTSVILGISGSGELGQQYSFRTALPKFFGESSHEIVSHFEQVLPKWTEDSFPGILMNVTAGRVANRFNLGGVNCTVDAACASSLAAVYMAVGELESRTSDMVIVGGADCMQNPFTYMCFSKTQALSPRGCCNALDESADGIVLGEGIVVMILKRLADAERDGNRIYGVIKGIGASSDGRDKSLTAPGRNGQIRALKRAYAKANVSPATVALIEAHATGTTVGDRVEVESLSQVFKESGAGQQVCAIGSIKSMIGHTKSSAGLASLMKATLALYHKVLPPTIGVKKPNPVLLLPDTPFYVNTETRPWTHHATDHPRRAGVSAFGFGGTNFHVVLEEYRDDYLEHLKEASLQEWPSELLVLVGHSRKEVLEGLKPLEEALAKGAKPSLANLAYSYTRMYEEKLSEKKEAQVCLAMVVSSLEDLSRKLNDVREALTSSDVIISDPRGFYFAEKPLASEGKVAFLFPGQGSQYIDMLADLAVNFPEIRACFERSDQILEKRLSRPLSHYIFPPPAFSEEEKSSRGQALAQTQIAQPAMGAADLAMYHLLESFGIQPEIVAGHSYGEYVALCAAGVIQESDLVLLSEARARFIVLSAGPDPGAMAAVNAELDTVEKIIGKRKGIWIANVNAPKQTVVTGTQSAVETVVDEFIRQGIQARQIPVSCAFHSPIISKASDQLKDLLSGIKLSAPQIKVFSNTTAKIYPTDSKAIADQLIQHLVCRVEFVREIEAMYEDGARIFVEVGPGRVLSNLVDQILGDRPHLAVISNQAGRPGLVQLQHLLGQLAVQGVCVQLERLFKLRSIQPANLSTLLAVPKDATISPTTWIVNGAQAIPISEISKFNPHRVITPMKLTAPAAMTGQHSQAGDAVQTHERGAKGEQPSERPISSTPVNNCEDKATIHSPHSGDKGNQVMVRYQRLMRRFLEVQKSVMLSYLQGEADNVETLSTAFDKTFQKARIQPPISAEGSQVESPTEERQSQPNDTVSGQAPIPSAANSEAVLETDDAAALSEKSTLDRKALTSKLLEIVSERTGYPQEMLELDVDLEADLGIDSIKRVEILSHFIQTIFQDNAGELPENMGNIGQVKTLRKIVEYLADHLESKDKRTGEKYSPANTAQFSKSTGNFKATGLLPRFTLEAQEIKLPARDAQPAGSRLILVTDDGRGIAAQLAEKLRSHGEEVAIVFYKEPPDETVKDAYVVKDTSGEAVAELVESIRKRQGPIQGLIHLLPLRQWTPFTKTSLNNWRERLQLDVKTLFHLLKLSEDELKQAAKERSGFVLSATGMGGSYACVSILDQSKFFPGHAAIPGLLKTVAIEWPEIKVKSVDLNLKVSNSILADHLLAEILSDDGLVEVGYDGSRRLALGLTDAPLAESAEDMLQMDSAWVLLITGGARGITAEVACNLAQRYQPTLILAGRSAVPPENESDLTVGLSGEKEMKSALISEMKSRGEGVKLADVKAAYEKLCKEREIRANLAAMRQAGAQVSYTQVDVRDEQQFGDLIDSISQTHGRLDGVIHGAGIIEDKLLTDKSWESFDRVFGTKTDSVFVLSKKLRPETLKFLVLFSSVAGRFGNAGQCDYTAANDVINKMAVYLDNRWSGRVLSVNWGPWAGGGMASAEVQRQFNQRGVALISPSQGPESLDLELRKGHKGESEVVIGDGPWKESALSVASSAIIDQNLPLLQHLASCTRINESLELVKSLDPNIEVFLKDHRLDAKPVLPAAMAIELMAEAAQMGWPEWKVTTVGDVRVFKGIVLNENSRNVRLIAQAKTDLSSSSKTAKLEFRITDSQQDEITFYRATLILTKDLPSPQSYEMPTHSGMSPFWTSAEGAYEKWLFHGPRFQCIKNIQGISKGGMLSTLVPSSPKACLANAPSGNWLIDPIVIDSGPQLALLWARNYLDITPLPSSFKAVHLYQPFHSASSIQCHFQVLGNHSKQSVCANVFYVDQQGKLLGMIERLESTGSRALNRLAGSHLFYTDSE